MKLKTLIKKLQELANQGYQESRVMVLKRDGLYWAMNEIEIDDVFDLESGISERTGGRKCLARSAVLLSNK